MTSDFSPVGSMQSGSFKCAASASLFNHFLPRSHDELVAFGLALLGVGVVVYFFFKRKQDL